MASVTLSGTLLDPTSEVAVGDQIRFTHRTTTGETIQFARSVLIIPPNGQYNITLEFGLIFVEYLDVKDVNYKNLGVVTVNGDTTATDLPGLLNAIVPPTDAQLLLFQAILADTETARDDAETSAVNALASENAAATSATATADALIVAESELSTNISQEFSFDIFDDMVSSTIEFPLKKIVSLKGYYSVDDGGHGAFIVVASSESVGIASTGVPSIKFKRVGGQDQWVKQYVGKMPKMLAHRGAAGYTEENLYFIPENSIYSARRASEAGFWGLEADAKSSSDGVLVVFHDNTVDRTITGETGSISSFTIAQIRAFDAGTYVSTTYTNTRVLDYRQWFESCRKNNLVPCPEISTNITDAQADQFVEHALRYFPNGHGVFLQSTNIDTLKRIRERNYNITLYRSFSFGSTPDVSLIDEMYELGNAGVHFSGDALINNPELVALANERGLCTSYAIANVREQLDTANYLGVHRIMTDWNLLES